MITRFLHKARLQVAISLLIVFSGGFACNWLCDFGITEVGFHANQQTYSVDIHDDDHHDSDLTGNPNNNHHHKSNGGDACCEEETNQLYSSLVNYVFPSFDLEKAPVLLQSIVFEAYTEKTSVIKWIEHYHLKRSLSPPSGVSLRILIQSFLN